MIIDNDLVFSKEQTLSATAVSTTVIDTKIDKNTTGINRPEMAVVVINHQLMAGTSPTIAISLEESSDNSTFTAIGGVSAQDGTTFKKAVIRMPIEHKRYLRLNYTIGGTVTTGAKVTSVMTTSLDAQQYYSKEDGSLR